MHRNTRLALALATNLFLTGLGILFYRRYLIAVLYFIPFVALRSSFAPEEGLLQFSLLGRGFILIASFVHIIILHRGLLNKSVLDDVKLPSQSHSLEMKGLGLLFRVLQGIGVAVWLIGGILMVGWYVAWLDAYFLWRYLANLVGVLTAPLIPVAVLIEWLWHGWPGEITSWFVLSASGIALSALAGLARGFLLGQTVE